MEHYMPEISWHDRKALLSVDINPMIKGNKYKIVTSSMQKEVRIWEFEFEKSDKTSIEVLSVNFVANLNGHNTAVNCVKFAHVEPGNLLASGDSDGRIVIWQMSDQPGPTQISSDEDELPPNRENWVRLKTLNHDEDVSTLCFSPDCKMIASVSRDNSLLVHDSITGRRILSLRNFRQFPNGLSWDPSGKYIMTMSTDRKMDLIDAVKGTKLRTWAMVDLPTTSICGLHMGEKPYRLFHDDQLVSFQRGVAFSPCGQLIVAPAGHLEIGTSDVYGSFVFLRQDIDKDQPLCFLPSGKPTFLIKMCPILFELNTRKQNYSGLPYRLIWLALTKETIIFYDSQHAQPIGFVENIHYNNLTDAAWSVDGRNVIISSLEGYCSFLKLKLDAWGCSIEKETLPTPPPSPQLIQVRKRKPKDKKDKKNEDEITAENVSVPDTPHQTLSSTPRTPKSIKHSTPLGKGSGIGSVPGTPKSASLMKFFRPKAEEAKTLNDQKITDLTSQEMDDNIELASAALVPSKTSEAAPIEVRKKKRVELVTLKE